MRAPPLLLPLQIQREQFYRLLHIAIPPLLRRQRQFPILWLKQRCNLELYIGPNGGVCTPVPLDDGAYICDLPGFLEHTDEVRCDDGIPKSCFVVTDTDIAVDLDGSTLTLAEHMRRSFHFNCVVRLVRIGGQPRTALSATRT
jgi:hypothetical protein